MLRKSASSLYRFSNQKSGIGKVLLLMKPEVKMYSLGVVITGVSSGLMLVIPQAFKQIGEL
jgi:hypothetical protein